MSTNPRRETTPTARWRSPADHTDAPGARGIVDNYVEIVARLADTAGRLADTVTDNDPRFGARSAGDVIRQAPGSYRRTALALNDSLIDVLDLRNWEGLLAPRAADAGQHWSPGDRSGPKTEDQIVATAQRFISRGQGGGATLDGLLRYLRPQVTLSDDELQALISRNFLVDDDLVFLSGADDSTAKAEVSDGIQDHLKALGFTDLRRDIPLERAHGVATARLVAYDSGKPAVLVFRVAAGRIDDPQTDEDARFQAKALSLTSPPRYIYLTDGRFNRYLDLQQDRLLSELPRAGMIPASDA